MRHRIVDTIPVACVTTRTSTSATAEIAPVTVDFLANAMLKAIVMGRDATIAATDTETARPLGAVTLRNGRAALMEGIDCDARMRSVWAQAAVETGVETQGGLAEAALGRVPRTPTTKTADFYIGLAALDTKTPVREIATEPRTLVIDVKLSPGLVLDAYGMPFDLKRELVLHLDANDIQRGVLTEVDSDAPTVRSGSINARMAANMIRMNATELLRSALAMNHMEAQELEPIIDRIPRQMCLRRRDPKRPNVAFLIDRKMREHVPSLSRHLPDRDFTYVIVTQRDNRLCRTVIGRADYEVTFERFDANA